MARVQTNFTGLRAVVESALGVADTTNWFVVEFDSIGAYGATITTVSRRPIGLRRGRRKGAVTNLESSVEFETDLTIDALTRFIEGFFFSEFVNVEFDMRATSGTVPPPAIASTDDFTVDSVSAALAAKIVYNVAGAITLFFAKGYTNAANNGLFALAVDVGSTDVAVQVNGSLVDETPPTNASLQVAGVRSQIADLALTVSGSTATLVSAAHIADWATLGFVAGMEIHIGSLTAAGVVQNGMGTGTDIFGYARISSVSTATLNLDKLGAALATDASNSTLTDVMYGRFVRDVEVTADADDTRFLERTFHFEASYPSLYSGPLTGYEYAAGNHGNDLTMNLPLTEKATLSMGFLGTTSDDFTTSRKTGASAAIATLRNTAFSTAIDLVSITTDVVASASDICFKSLGISILNNMSPEYCLGVLGASFVNAGLFQFDIEGQMAFTSATIVDAIRNNTTVTFHAILRNEDGAVAIDVPEMTLGGGGREFPVDATVLVNITGESYTSDTYDFNAGMTFFAAVPYA